MDAIYERCCGLDIHKRTVVACLIVPGSGRQSRKEIRTFGTMTDDLLALADWMAAEGVTHVAMESAPRGAWLHDRTAGKEVKQAPVDPGMAPTTPEAVRRAGDHEEEPVRSPEGEA